MSKPLATVWIALSSQGHPSPVCGFSYTRKALVQQYLEKYGHSLQGAGYRPVRVTINLAWVSK